MDLLPSSVHPEDGVCFFELHYLGYWGRIFKMSCFEIFRAVAESGTEGPLFWYLKVYPLKHFWGNTCILPGEIKPNTSNSADVEKICGVDMCGHDYCHVKANMV